MIKIKDMSLEELYAKPKITPSVETAIVSKEDFTRIQPNYCEKVCKLKCKSYTNVQLDHREVDVLILQDHTAPRDGYKDGERIERSHQAIITELCRRNLQGLSYKLINVMKCKLEDEDMARGNKPPTSAVQLKCSPYLKKEIELSNPKVIISLTNNATKVLGLKKSNYTNRGEIHGNVVLTLHPKITLMIRQNASGKMWGSDYWEVIDRDFNKAGRMARGELQVPELDISIERQKSNIFICRTIEDVLKAYKELLALPPRRIISFDTETTGLDPWHPDAKLLTIQFGYRLSNGNIRSIVIPLRHRENKGYDPDVAWGFVKVILESNLPKIGHNVKFDILYIYATTGVRVKNVVFDTMLILHNMNSGIQGNYGLKRAVWDFLPESGLGGYEDKLPKLTEEKKDEEEENVES